MAGIGFAENELVSMTRNAIESSFLEDDKKNKILWAKNIKIPFRSNLKIFNNKLIAADQNAIEEGRTILEQAYRNRRCFKQELDEFSGVHAPIHSRLLDSTDHSLI